MLQKIFEQQKFTDITIKLDDGEIKAHKCVLIAADIEYFNKVFNSDNVWTETSSNVITIKELSKDLFMLLIKTAYEFKQSTQFDPQYLADLLVVGSRFNYQKMIDKVTLIIKNLNIKKADIWLQYVLKIFLKFSPIYDYILKDNMSYKTKQISFFPGFDDDSKTNKIAINYEIVRIMKNFKVKYIRYLCHLDNDHYITYPFLKVLLQKYDENIMNNIFTNVDIYEGIVDLLKIIDVSLLEDDDFIELLEKYGFITVQKKERDANPLSVYNVLN